MKNNNKHSSHSHHNHGDMNHSKHENVSTEEHRDHNKDQHHDHHAGLDHGGHSGHDHGGHSGHDHSGHSGHNHHHHGNFKELFLKSLPLGIIIMLLSPMAGFDLPFQFSFPYSDIVVAILSTILIIYGGRPFYQGAVDEFKQKEPGMMALVSLGLSVSYLYSIYTVITSYVTGEQIMDFFFEFASLLLIMLLGHWIEMKAIGEAGDAQEELAKLVPKDAHVVLEDDSIETRPVADLQVGDLIRVQAGENVPADGTIERGESRLNEALLTGESKAVKKGPGDEVIGARQMEKGFFILKYLRQVISPLSLKYRI